MDGVEEEEEEEKEEEEDRSEKSFLKWLCDME